MAYTEAQKDAAVAALQRHLPGIDPRFARGWVNAEQGSCNNILGVTSSSGNCGQYAGGSQGCGSVRRLCSFRTMDDGAAAAARLINGSGYYDNLARAIRERRGGIAQANALINSPWAGNRWWYYDIFKRIYGKDALKAPYNGVRQKKKDAPKSSSTPKKSPIAYLTDSFTADTASCGAGPVEGSTEFVINAFRPECLQYILNVDGSHTITEQDVQDVASWLNANGSSYWTSQGSNSFDGTLNSLPFIRNRILGTKISDRSTAVIDKADLNAPFNFGIDLDGITRGIMFVGVVILGAVIIGMGVWLMGGKPTGLISIGDGQ